MIADELAARLGSDAVLRDELTLRSCRRDAWVLSELDDLEQSAVALPCCVVRPRSVQDVVTLVREKGLTPDTSVAEPDLEFGAAPGAPDPILDKALELLPAAPAA